MPDTSIVELTACSAVGVGQAPRAVPLDADAEGAVEAEGEGEVVVDADADADGTVSSSVTSVQLLLLALSQEFCCTSADLTFRHFALFALTR